MFIKFKNLRNTALQRTYVRSLFGNYDDFIHMLTEINFSFPIIGLSETIFVTHKDNLSNVSMVGYNLISTPSLSNAGGVAFYLTIRPRGRMDNSP